MSDELPTNPVMPNATVNLNVQGVPAQGAVVNQNVVRILAVVGVVAAAALAASQAGVLPPWVGAVAQAVIGLLATAGIASPGIRKV